MLAVHDIVFSTFFVVFDFPPDSILATKGRLPTAKRVVEKFLYEETQPLPNYVDQVASSHREVGEIP